MGVATKFVMRNCVACGMELEVLEARDCDTGEVVPVPEDIICGRCAAKLKRKLKLYEARDHFARAVTQWFEECCEGELFKREQGIEDWVLDFQRYLADGLRGKHGVNPEHPVFKTRYGDG